jgi:hypothetical protein
MKKTKRSVFLLICISITPVFAQDEGTIEKKERFVRGRSIYLTAGPSFRFLSTSDYKVGLNLEAGIVKRMTRRVSSGFTFSLLKINYSSKFSDSFGASSAKGNNIFQEDGGYEMYHVKMRGGNLTLLSMGLNTRINFAPPEEGKPSVYGIAKLSGFACTRSEVGASVDIWYANTIPYDNPRQWSGGDPFDELSPITPGLERWAKDTEYGVAINIGVGADFPINNNLSLTIMSSVGFTTSLTHIRTNEYPPSRNSGYNHPDYPFVSEGFKHISVSIGGSYRF